VIERANCAFLTLPVAIVLEGRKYGIFTSFTPESSHALVSVMLRNEILEVAAGPSQTMSINHHRKVKPPNKLPRPRFLRKPQVSEIISNAVDVKSWVSGPLEKGDEVVCYIQDSMLFTFAMHPSEPTIELKTGSEYSIAIPRQIVQ
jgi:hypothetical protein